MFSKTQEARFLLWAACHKWSPFWSMTSASPGWISRSSLAPRWSSAHVSDATTQPSL